MKFPDDNDRLRQGSLPANPLADALPMAEAMRRSVARKRADLADYEAELASLEGSQGLDADSDFEEAAPPVGSLLPRAFATFHRRAEGTERPIPLPWNDVAKALGGGLWPGLSVLVGGTGSGKTQWALQLALHAARQATPGLYIGLEMEEAQFVARLVSLALAPALRLRWSDLWQGLCKAEEWRHATDAGQELARLPLRAEMAPPYEWSAANLRFRVQAFLRSLAPGPHKTQPPTPPLVILDFLQLVASEKGEEARERIQKAAYTARAIAKEEGLAILLVSGTARVNYPQLKADDHTIAQDLVGLGKESGEVEYAADAVLVLAREESPTHADAFPRPMRLVLAKNRAGPVANVKLLFDGTRFDGGAPTGPKAGSKSAHSLRVP